ncbi:kinase-like domain-containing protein [Rhizophagus diaphanus]|nr:kinase-like domain-containing protein [Rhizophagus diaphanus] [Rhizophagus sp. MUCL 43196]
MATNHSMLWFNTKSVKWKLYACNEYYGYRFKKIITTNSKPTYMERKNKNCLFVIHNENAIHRDLHSGNVLYSELNQHWFISDLGFCGLADKSTESIYGNLPYIAPEVISGKKTTVESDIYSIGMLMWEISSGQPPFSDYENK